MDNKQEAFLIDCVWDAINSLLIDGDYDIVNDVFKEIDVASIDCSLLLSFLVSTQGRKHAMSYRAVLLAKARQFYISDCPELFDGLD